MGLLWVSVLGWYPMECGLKEVKTFEIWGKKGGKWEKTFFQSEWEKWVNMVLINLTFLIEYFCSYNKTYAGDKLIVKTEGGI